MSIERTAEQEADEAFQAALDSPSASPDVIAEDVYSPSTVLAFLNPGLDGGSRIWNRREMTMGQAIHQALDEALSRDDRVLILGEDIEHMGNVGGTTMNHGTDRVRQTPISESAIIGTSVGAALGGMRPVPEIMFMDFLGVCMDQIANGAAKLRYTTGGRTTVPITIRTITYGGGGFGSGATHSQSLEAWLMHVPGLKVVYPSSPSDAKGLLASCIEDDDPCIFIECTSPLWPTGPCADRPRVSGCRSVKPPYDEQAQTSR